ncbi:YfhO family protein [Liquorilactobacillus uvarum]|uniref:YfhO family protein n=1 Tax=Liquorilactobacillus uvarum TaxID=303240 RepID=UPI00288B4B60|nr:YfhO family protein [Liquorilactobacillus uvarum]
MQFSFEKKHNGSLYLKYTLIFLFVSFFVYGTYLITGHSLIWRLDGAQQHLPLLQEYQHFLRSFLHHPLQQVPQWSWKLGIGGDLFQIYSYYVLGDFFSYLTLLFPASKIVFAYQFLIVLRLYCAGIAFCFFASHFKLSHSVIITGALVYIFNAFLLYSNIAQPFFTIPFIIFPLLIIALERVLQGLSVWPLILVFCWMLFNNFYFAYMLGIGAAIFLVLRYLLYYRKKIHLFKTFFKLSFCTLISLGLTAIVLVPEIFAVQNSTRSDGVFANGLTLYPLYYYLALPSQLINGGNRGFYFWSALGFASIVFFAIVYILAKWRHYPLLASVFVLGGIMLLFPLFGAFFNGFMAPSNRWTLMLALPFSFACCILITNTSKISSKTVHLFRNTLFAYAIFIICCYYFQNDEKIFIPLLFLFVTYRTLVFYSRHKVAKTAHAFLIVVLLNVILNAVYFEAPYNGGYSNEMLPFGSYEKLIKHRYAGLNNNLKTTNTYRVSTISSNYYLGSGFHMYNTLPSNTNSVSSYYSLQNKNIGAFANIMQNSQFEANIPLGQLDDRTILNNFFGVRYLFTQINQANEKKIPAGYTLDKVSSLISDANQKSSQSQQTQRYRSNYAFPLIYWQDSAFSSSTYSKMSPTQKERSLATGVYLNTKTIKSLKKASVSHDVQNVDYQLISSRGNFVSSRDIQRKDSNESYLIILKNPEAYKNSELHLEFSDIKYTPEKLKNQLELEQQARHSSSTNSTLTLNDSLSYYQNLRYHILQGTPDNSFSLTVASPITSGIIKQPKQNELSFYKTVKNSVLNMGYFASLPTNLTLTPSKIGNYHFKLKITAEKIDNNYFAEVKKIQKNGLKELKFSRNRVSGNIITSRSGVITSSIPYSKGWTATDNGTPVHVLKTNNAFVGFKLKPGKHHIILSYQTPGLKLGWHISLVSVLLVLIYVFFKSIKKRLG